MVDVRFHNVERTRLGYFIYKKAHLKGLLGLVRGTHDIDTVRQIKAEAQREFLQPWMANEIGRACNAKIREMELNPRSTWKVQFGETYLYQKLGELGADVAGIAAMNPTEKQLIGLVTGLRKLRTKYPPVTAELVGRVEAKLHELQHKRQVRSTEMAEKKLGDLPDDDNAHFWEEVDEIEATDPQCVQWSKAERALEDFLARVIVLEASA